MNGTVQTVLGPISPESLGTVLIHEHLFLDLRDAWRLEPSNPEQIAITEAKVELSTLGRIRRDPLLCPDNLVLDDEATLLGELQSFASVGGGTVVDVTCQGMGRDVDRVARISQSSGVHVVAATGHYVEPSHPPDLSDRSVASLVNEYMQDIAAGIAGTEIKAGIIGEIGLSLPITPVQKRVLEAAVITQRETGLALSIHPPWPRGAKWKVMSLLYGFGAHIDRVILAHCCLEHDTELLTSLADEGIVLSFDTFGHEHYRDVTGIPDPRDTQRITVLVELLKRGYSSSIVLSQDLACKIECKAYGGWGLTHVDDHIVPVLRQNQVDETELTQMRKITPARLLARNGA